MGRGVGGLGALVGVQVGAGLGVLVGVQVGPGFGVFVGVGWTTTLFRTGTMIFSF